MTHEEFKDRIFEILNNTSELPIADINTRDRENLFEIILTDDSEFLIRITDKKDS